LLTAGGEKDNVAHLPVRVFDRGLGNAEQHAGIARYARQVIQQFIVDLFFGAHADLADDLNEQVGEVVGDLSAAEPARVATSAVRNAGTCARNGS